MSLWWNNSVKFKYDNVYLLCKHSVNCFVLFLHSSHPLTSLCLSSRLLSLLFFLHFLLKLKLSYAASKSQVGLVVQEDGARDEAIVWVDVCFSGDVLHISQTRPVYCSSSLGVPQSAHLFSFFWITETAFPNLKISLKTILKSFSVFFTGKIGFYLEH